MKKKENRRNKRWFYREERYLLPKLNTKVFLVANFQVFCCLHRVYIFVSLVCFLILFYNNMIIHSAEPSLRCSTESTELLSPQDSCVVSASRSKVLSRQNRFVVIYLPLHFVEFHPSGSEFMMMFLLFVIA